jgi:hypothetical protein
MGAGGLSAWSNGPSSRLAATTEAVDRMGLCATEEVLRVLRGEDPRHRVA